MLPPIWLGIGLERWSSFICCTLKSAISNHKTIFTRRWVILVVVTYSTNMYVCMYVCMYRAHKFKSHYMIWGAPQLTCQHISVPTENKSLLKPFLMTAKQIFNPKSPVYTCENNFPLTFEQFAYHHWLGKKIILNPTCIEKEEKFNFQKVFWVIQPLSEQLQH